MVYSRTNWPAGYLITFTTYGTWLHGNAVGSILKSDEYSGTVLITGNPELEMAEFKRLKDMPFKMNEHQRRIVLAAILEVCQFRNWIAHAVHVRSNHIHAVVCAKAKPEKIMNDFKVYATKALRKETVRLDLAKVWTRHGSTKYLWYDQALDDAIKYVRDGQGKMMAFGKTQQSDNRSCYQTPDHSHIQRPDREGGEK
jgi:REP element-mobilizing transposase RayT